MSPAQADELTAKRRRRAHRGAARPQGHGGQDCTAHQHAPHVRDRQGRAARLRGRHRRPADQRQGGRAGRQNYVRGASRPWRRDSRSRRRSRAPTAAPSSTPSPRRYSSQRGVSVGPDPQRTGVRFGSGPPCVRALLGSRRRPRGRGRARCLADGPGAVLEDEPSVTGLVRRGG